MRTTPVFMAAILLALCPLARAREEGKGTPLAWAIRLVKELKPDATSYTHDDPVVRWEGGDGGKAAECRTDCSGLLDALLKQSYGYTEDAFKDWLGRKRPLAKTYHDAIVDGNRFKRIEHIGDVKPGDVIAIKYKADDPENKGGDTGHVMIVMERPIAHGISKPVQEGTDQWAVAVIDESRSYHGPTDSRYLASGKDGSGAGRGVFRLYTDKEGSFVGHAWSLSKVSEYHDQDDRHLVIGRLEP